MQRLFTNTYNQEIDWSGTVALQLVPFTTTYQYDALNRPTQITQPNSMVETLSYNEGGLLESVASSSGVGISNIDYNARGQRTQIEYNNGAVTTRVYDSNTFRLKQLKTTRVSTSETEEENATDTLQNIHYIYDAVGNITAQKNYAEQTHYFRNSAIEPVSLYTYDALYRLTEATGRELTALQLPTKNDFVNSLAVPNTASNAMQNYTQQFLYDDLGNIAQMKSDGNWTRNYFYDIATNHLQGHSNGVNEYSYDAHGNTTAMPHLSSMLWDYKDELTEVDLGGGGTAYYTYDSSGNRTRKVIKRLGDDEEIRFYLDGYELFQKKTSSGSLDFERQTVTITDDEKVFARVERKTVENKNVIATPASIVRYQYDNHLGSASLELDSVAAIISYEEYHPFGTTAYRSGKTETEVSLKRYKYCGKERDDETGLYYYGARYYAAWLGRFVSVDPLSHQTPSWNPYHYCHGNPVNLVDPSGMRAEGPDGDDTPKLPNTDGKIILETDKAIEEYNNFMYGQSISKNGKKIKTKSSQIEPAFVEIIDNIKAKADGKVHITTNFDHIKDFSGVAKEPGGTIAYDGNDYWIYYDPEMATDYGASGIFEESYHLNDAIIGDHMKFAKGTGANSTYGIDGMDINDEVRAKMWVANNIESVKLKKESSSDSRFLEFTHYGYVKELHDSGENAAKKLHDGIPEKSLNGTEKLTHSTETTFGSVPGVKYRPAGFSGEEYGKFSMKKLYPNK